MTTIEFFLLLSILALVVHIVILQHHYSEKFSEQGLILDYLIDQITEQQLHDKYESIKTRLFNSSQ